MSGCICRAIPWVMAGCFAALISSCAHHLGPKNEPARVARELGLGSCTVSESMRRYQVLDFADLLGNPNLADSSEWATAMSKVQPGDEFRHVHCYSTGDNYFGLFRGRELIFRFGSMLYD
jgi:hypothetical protein